MQNSFIQGHVGSSALCRKRVGRLEKIPKSGLDTKFNILLKKRNLILMGKKLLSSLMIVEHTLQTVAC